MLTIPKKYAIEVGSSNAFREWLHVLARPAIFRSLALTVERAPAASPGRLHAVCPVTCERRGATHARSCGADAWVSERLVAARSSGGDRRNGARSARCRWVLSCRGLGERTGPGSRPKKWMIWSYGLPGSPCRRRILAGPAKGSQRRNSLSAPEPFAWLDPNKHPSSPGNRSSFSRALGPSHALEGCRASYCPRRARGPGRGASHSHPESHASALSRGALRARSRSAVPYRGHGAGMGRAAASRRSG